MEEDNLELIEFEDAPELLAELAENMKKEIPIDLIDKCLGEDEQLLKEEILAWRKEKNIKNEYADFKF